MNEIHIITIYTIIDDFFQAYYKTNLWNAHKYLWLNKRGFQKRLSLSEIITLNIIRFYLRIEDLKTFHRFATDYLTGYFPRIPSYSNFLIATNNSMIFVMLFVKYLLNINRNISEKLNFADSTDISVCKNYNISSHKVAKGIAERGKTSKGWFYGFKLHGVCDANGLLKSIFFTSGEVHDNKTLYDLLKDIRGMFYCDSGYLLKSDELEKFFAEDKKLYIATRKNMKRLMTKEQNNCFKKRSIIETIWDVLKERYKLVYYLARSITGYFRHYLYSICSYMLKKSFVDQYYILLYENL